VPLDWNGVSGRIRGLVSMSDQAQLSAAANRLGVEERHLRDAIEQQSRTSTLKVIAAIVRVYGLDPTWVLTGTYDSTTHRVAIQRDSSEIEVLLSRLVANASQDEAENTRILDFT
jgi:hypothetical protein